MRTVYSRLRDVGLTKPYVEKVALPDWWDDSLAENPAGFAQCLMLLSRHLGIDIESLQDPTGRLRLREFGVCKYKKRANTTNDVLLLSRVIATRAAQLAAAAIEQPFLSVPTASEIRQSILEDASWVGLEELLNYCWSIGIPVVHVNLFPPKAKRPDGFALRIHRRPVIVLCRKECQPSWLAFILAHELGHIACGHIPDDGALLDERLRDNEEDQEEREADQFATELLTGKSTTNIGAGGRWPNMQRLATQAQEVGHRHNIDPGHVVLNYARTMGVPFFSVAREALKKLYPHANAIRLVRNKLANNLDWAQLPEDSSAFLMRITCQDSEQDG